MKRGLICLIVVVLGALLPGGLARAEDADVCPVSDDLVPTDRPLTHVAAAIAAKHLVIDVVGSASSTLRGPNGAQNAYPGQLEMQLRNKLPGVTVGLKTYIEATGTTADMATRLAKILPADKPNLVIWQTGTADLMLGNEPEAFAESLEKGFAAVQSAGADAILVNLQYSPRTDPMTNAKPYADTMRTAAEDHNVPLFDRMGIMKYWSDQGTFDFYATGNDGTINKVHACLGRLLADLILGSVKAAEAGH